MWITQRNSRKNVKRMNILKRAGYKINLPFNTEKGIFTLTNLFGKAMIYPVIALWKLEKPIVRKAPAGAFRYLWK